MNLFVNGVSSRKNICQKIRSKYGIKSDRWFLDKVYIKIRGRLHYLWRARAVDQDGEIIDILVQKHKDKRAALRFFRKLLKKQGRAPFELMTDMLIIEQRTHIRKHANRNDK